MAERRAAVLRMSCDELARLLYFPAGTRVVAAWVPPDSEGVIEFRLEGDTLPTATVGQALPEVRLGLQTEYVGEKVSFQGWF